MSIAILGLIRRSFVALFTELRVPGGAFRRPRTTKPSATARRYPKVQFRDHANQIELLKAGPSLAWREAVFIFCWRKVLKKSLELVELHNLNCLHLIATGNDTSQKTTLS